MKSLKKLYIAWKKEDLPEFKKQLRTISVKSYEPITGYLEKNFDALYDDKNCAYQELIITWLKKHQLSNKGQYEYFLKKVFDGEKYIKEKNETYLKVCSQFPEFRSAQFIPHGLTEHWSEGLKVFTNLILDKFSSKDKQSYLVEMFSCVTPESNKVIKELFSDKEIKEVLQKQKDRVGNHQFWAENWPVMFSYSDTKTLYLLEWSDSYDFGIESHQNIDDYIQSKNSKTLEYLINRFGVQHIFNETLPLIEKKINEITHEQYKIQRQEELTVLKPQLLFYKMQSDLPETNKGNKTLKL
jgi:hypothetical protein